MIWGKLISLDVLIYQTGHNNIHHAFLTGLFGGSGVCKWPEGWSEGRDIYFASYIFKDEYNAPFFLLLLLENGSSSKL